MRDLFLAGFLGLFLVLAVRRPFLLILCYAYIDIVAPQRLSYFLLNSVPVSAMVFGLAFLSWLAFDNKRDARFSWRQFLMVLLLGYCAWTTGRADFPVEAQEKWDWVWKALVFAIFLPLTLRTKLRIESLTLFMVLCASTIIITGGLKTALSGGGYGVLVLLVDNNSGLYEGSIISTVAIAIIPLILWLMKFGTIFRPEWRVTAFGVGLIFTCLLIPVGTQARTGLVCIGVLGVLMLRFTRYRLVYMGLAGTLAILAFPFLPQSFTERMGTIVNHQADESASTRVEVWRWTWNHAQENPFGGGFDAYRQNRLVVKKLQETESKLSTVRNTEEVVDEGRAYHSSYFEMLGEQGYPGLLLWLMIHLSGVFRMEWLRRHYTKHDRPGEEWIAPLALALQNGQIIYMIGSFFVGIAFQPFIYMLIALQIGLDTYLARLRKAEKAQPIFHNAALQTAEPRLTHPHHS